MNKKSPTPEELLRMEYEFSEYKDVLPEELRTVLEKIFNQIHSYITIELPLQNELSRIIEILIYKQSPSLSTYVSSWLVGWMKEISENIAQQLATDLSFLFDDFANGISRADLYDDFEKMVKFYISPAEADRSEMPNFEGSPFWEQEKESILKEWEDDYKERKASCERFNLMKKEFIQAVQPIIFKYFGQQTETFTTEMWLHFGILLGSAYLEFSDNCSDLEYALEVDELTNDPKIGFYEYNQQISARILGIMKDESLQLNLKNN